MLAIPASAVALTANLAHAQSATQIKLNRHQVAYGRPVKVTGSTSPSAAGARLALQFAVPHGSWHQIASTRVGNAGHFRFDSVIKHSGLMRVSAAGAGTAPRTASTLGVGGASVAPSASQSVSVAARFSVNSRQFSVLGGQPVHIRGKLLPGVGGRHARLIGRSGRSWHTLASARTGARGGFDLRYAPGGTGHQWLRVRFAGDSRNTPASTYAGRVTTFRPSLASWFTDGGATACGLHAYYGVANNSLPCGTKVTFRYGHRRVTATVEDRGPFVGGRKWDLNQNTATALGFGGVGTVWSSI